MRGKRTKDVPVLCVGFDCTRGVLVPSSANSVVGVCYDCLPPVTPNIDQAPPTGYSWHVSPRWYPPNSIVLCIRSSFPSIDGPLFRPRTIRGRRLLRNRAANSIIPLLVLSSFWNSFIICGIYPLFSSNGAYPVDADTLELIANSTMSIISTQSFWSGHTAVLRICPIFLLARSVCPSV
jgi:hypothetical protein